MQLNNEQILTAQIIKEPSILWKGKYCLKSEDYEERRNREIVHMVAILCKQDIDVDALILAQKLPGLEASYLAALGNVFTTANWEFYHDQVKEASMWRKLGRIPMVLNDLRNTGASSSEAIREIDSQMQAMMMTLNSEYENMPIQKILPQIVERVEESFKKAQSDDIGYNGYLTGISALDEILQGISNDNYVIIGARPSHGKTALGVKIADNIANLHKVKVGIISTESSGLQLGFRLASANSRVQANKLRSGMMSGNDFADFRKGLEKLYERKIFINDEPNASLDSVCNNIRKMVRINGCKVIVVDYAQNITMPNSRKQKTEELEIITNTLKQLNRTLGVPIIALAQVNRDGDGQKPRSAQIKGSGAFEQSADTIVLIHKQEEGEGEQKQERTFLIVDKNRDGATDECEVFFNKPLVSFEDLNK